MISLDVSTISLLIGISFLVLMASGFPIAFAMLTVATVGYLVFVGPQALDALFPILFSTVTTDIFIAIPLFIFMASVFQVSGIGERMYEAMYKWMAGLRGGLAIGTVIICTVIAAITGLVATGTIMMGMLAYPEMRKRGYDKGIAIGSIIAGGCLGPLIPPSVPMIIISGLTGVSSGKLFISGVMPGLICSFLFCAYIGIRCFYNKSLAPSIPIDQRANWRDKFGSLGGLLFPILLILLVLGGIYAGAFTPSEAGAIGAAGALISTAILGNLTWKNVSSAVTITFRANAMVLWLGITGVTISSLTGITGVKNFVGGFLVGLPMGPYGILLIMLIIVFIMGCFLDSLAIIMITLPIMMPVAVQLGFDPLWFALLFIFNIIIGMLTPPFGYTLFYFKGLGHADVSMMDIYKSAGIFVICMAICLVLCIVFPQIPLWLPNKMIR